MHQQPEKVSGSCCAGRVGQKDPLLWAWCGSSLLLWILQQRPIFTVLPDLCSAPVGFSFLGAWEVTDPSVPPRYLSPACQPFPEATKACNNFSLTKTLVMRDPKSQNCIGNADLINKLFPQEHCMDGINQTLSHRQIDIPACQLRSFPCWWRGAQCCFFQIQGNADCKSREMLEGEAMAREPFAIAVFPAVGPTVPALQGICPFLGSTLPHEHDCQAHRPTAVPFGLAHPPKVNRNPWPLLKVWISHSFLSLLLVTGPGSHANEGRGPARTMAKDILGWMERSSGKAMMVLTTLGYRHVINWRAPVSF